MKNLEVQTLTDLIVEAHRAVRYAANSGERDEVYRDELAQLGRLVAAGSRMLRTGRQAVGGSPARIGERPPRGVAVETWREFVRQLVPARSTWFNEARAQRGAES